MRLPLDMWLGVEMLYVNMHAVRLGLECIKVRIEMYILGLIPLQG